LCKAVRDDLDRAGEFTPGTRQRVGRLCAMLNDHLSEVVRGVLKKGVNYLRGIWNGGGRKAGADAVMKKVVLNEIGNSREGKGDLGS